MSGEDPAGVRLAAEVSCGKPLPEGCRLLGPSEAAMAKIADKYRYSALITAESHRLLKRAAVSCREAFEAEREKHVRMDVDIDPRNLM